MIGQFRNYLRVFLGGGVCFVLHVRYNVWPTTQVREKERSGAKGMGLKAIERHMETKTLSSKQKATHLQPKG